MPTIRKRLEDANVSQAAIGKLSIYQLDQDMDRGMLGIEDGHLRLLGIGADCTPADIKDLTGVRSVIQDLRDVHQASSTSRDAGMMEQLRRAALPPRPVKAWVGRWRVYNLHGARFTISTYMSQFNLSGTVRRLNPREVVVEAVAHPDKGMDLHSFFNLLYRVAPIRGLLKWSGTEGAAQQHNQQKEVLTDEQVEAHLKRGEPFTLLEIIPKLSYNVNILAALDRAVQVLKVPTQMRSQYSDPSRVSDDPEGAQETVSSMSSAMRQSVYG